MLDIANYSHALYGDDDAYTNTGETNMNIEVEYTDTSYAGSLGQFIGDILAGFMLETLIDVIEGSFLLRLALSLAIMSGLVVGILKFLALFWGFEGELWTISH